MLELADAWVWDSWLVDDGDYFHAFYLKASKALLDPDRRHFRASIGHSVSIDLIDWTEQPDALVPGDEPAFDDLATWTGSIVSDPTGGWRMFYTGVARAERGQVQRIGSAFSDDLAIWTRDGEPFGADARWYEQESIHDTEQAWRDPWVFQDPKGDGWHMLINACVAGAGRTDRGVIGHATSPDLRTWTSAPPLSAPGNGFGHLEVMQLVTVAGTTWLIFSCLGTDIAGHRIAAGQRGGMWASPAGGPLGPFDLEHAISLTGPELYAGHLIRDRRGQWVLIGFVNNSSTGFCGVLTDPVPIAQALRPRSGAPSQSSTSPIESIEERQG